MSLMLFDVNVDCTRQNGQTSVPDPDHCRVLSGFRRPAAGKLIAQLSLPENLQGGACENPQDESGLAVDGNRRRW